MEKFWHTEDSKGATMGLLQGFNIVKRCKRSKWWWLKSTVLSLCAKVHHLQSCNLVTNKTETRTRNCTLKRCLCLILAWDADLQILFCSDEGLWMSGKKLTHKSPWRIIQTIPILMNTWRFPVCSLLTVRYGIKTEKQRENSLTLLSKGYLLIFLCITLLWSSFWISEPSLHLPQGLLKVAVENARVQDKQIQAEKRELKMELYREREMRESLERQLTSELQSRGQTK